MYVVSEKTRVTVQVQTWHSFTRDHHAKYFLCMQGTVFPVFVPHTRIFRPADLHVGLRLCFCLFQEALISLHMKGIRHVLWTVTNSGFSRDVWCVCVCLLSPSFSPSLPLPLSLPPSPPLSLSPRAPREYMASICY